MRTRVKDFSFESECYFVVKKGWYVDRVPIPCPNNVDRELDLALQANYDKTSEEWWDQQTKNVWFGLRLTNGTQNEGGELAALEIRNDCDERREDVERDEAVESRAEMNETTSLSQYEEVSSIHSPLNDTTKYGTPVGSNLDASTFDSTDFFDVQETEREAEAEAEPAKESEDIMSPCPSPFAGSSVLNDGNITNSNRGDEMLNLVVPIQKSETLQNILEDNKNNKKEFLQRKREEEWKKQLENAKIPSSQEDRSVETTTPEKTSPAKSRRIFKKFAERRRKKVWKSSKKQENKQTEESYHQQNNNIHDKGISEKRRFSHDSTDNNIHDKGISEKKRFSHDSTAGSDHWSTFPVQNDKSEFNQPSIVQRLNGQLIHTVALPLHDPKLSIPIITTIAVLIPFIYVTRRRRYQRDAETNREEDDVPSKETQPKQLQLNILDVNSPRPLQNGSSLTCNERGTKHAAAFHCNANTLPPSQKTIKEGGIEKGDKNFGTNLHGRLVKEWAAFLPMKEAVKGSSKCHLLIHKLLRLSNIGASPERQLNLIEMWVASHSASIIKEDSQDRWKLPSMIKDMYQYLRVKYELPSSAVLILMPFIIATARIEDIGCEYRLGQVIFSAEERLQNIARDTAKNAAVLEKVKASNVEAPRLQKEKKITSKVLPPGQRAAIARDVMTIKHDVEKRRERVEKAVGRSVQQLGRQEALIFNTDPPVESSNETSVKEMSEEQMIQAREDITPASIRARIQQIRKNRQKPSSSRSSKIPPNELTIAALRSRVEKIRGRSQPGKETVPSHTSSPCRASLAREESGCDEQLEQAVIELAQSESIESALIFDQIEKEFFKEEERYQQSKSSEKLPRYSTELSPLAKEAFKFQTRLRTAQHEKTA